MINSILLIKKSYLVVKVEVTTIEVRHSFINA